MAPITPKTIRLPSRAGSRSTLPAWQAWQAWQGVWRFQPSMVAQKRSLAVSRLQSMTGV